MTEVKMRGDEDHHLAQLRRAERSGLRLAITLRTAVVALCLVWYAAYYGTVDERPRIVAFAALSIFIAIGIAHLSVIGTKVDRPWIKFVVTAADLAAASSLFAIIPVSRADDVPQIVAFRAYGIYYLFPLIALTCLTLSWRLVIWSGIIAAIGWWAAFFWSIMDIERPLSWGDIPVDATRSDYQNFFFSFDFVGYGNRLEETGFLLAAAIVLAAAVYRARKVFFAQVAAEMDREAERQARSAVTETLGRFVPEQIVQQLIDNKGALDPPCSMAACLRSISRGLRPMQLNAHRGR